MRKENIVRKFSLVKLLLISAFLIFSAAPVLANEGQLPKVGVSEDGLHVQKWFHDSFLDLREDLAEAKAKGKRLVIMWEQKGCPYCKRTHEVNLRIPRIVKFITDNFVVIQLNLWGDKEVTDFDGEVTTEKKLSQKWAVRFTPTIQFFAEDLKDIGKKDSRTAEVMRIPGYFKPFHFYFLFKYVKSNAYKTEPNFQRWLGEEGDKLAAKGLDIQKQLWADELLFEE
ncbi:MAG: thioredoxin fold domain-containing protein [Rhodospirillaceae bacterium]|jgi:thioredoxin-related protein|nr:thioredoxin fold domain-containing protein [Rhodospirillaceae bacterium]MBT4589411.1 thioredoxin fold domain-containing protein [Rhodospirillaceae bacterium]MBT4939638.1 thioredoxin fold domain-containing protein [Rhodospirillaceae bacterium]MBT5941131.1 thioredoxin fold domain-containing protein [Rhodospirillaceae bacterium]MBT7956973.1 thioredoxin fold domain-containing protein [Rhodospirillaceae bacterium]